MVAVGVESYAVDYRSHRTTFYFAVDAIRAGIRGSQRGLIRYSGFRRRSMQAGCVGYTAWISGGQVTYFGRQGETHVERFPH